MSSAVSLKKFQFFPFLINLLITLAIGFVAAFFTRPEIKGWYRPSKSLPLIRRHGCLPRYGRACTS